MTTEAIILDSLTTGYGRGRSRKVVSRGLSATVCRGQLTCLLGPNGIGKSTLLRTVSAFQPPLEGSVLIASGNGRPQPISSLSAKALSRLIGVVLTEKPDVHNMTAEEMVAMGRSPYTGFWGRLAAADAAVVDESLQAVGIAAMRSRLMHTLSDGERQKVMIAKALAQQTPVICLDEPTAFLDFKSKVEVMLLLRSLAHSQQKTILLSTHDVELALQTADNVWLMSRDSIAAGTPRELADRRLLDGFLQQPGISFNPATMTINITATI